MSQKNFSEVKHLKMAKEQAQELDERRWRLDSLKKQVHQWKMLYELQDER